MNRKQKIALYLGVCNITLLLLFPPCDTYSFIDPDAHVFAGFHYLFDIGKNEVINVDVWFLEIAILLINIGVVWLLLRTGQSVFDTKHRFNYQNIILLLVAVNLTVIILFPPFEYYYAMTNAPIPSFQGFYFIFAAGPMLAIVTPLLYLEVIYVLINGALLWLLFKREE